MSFKTIARFLSLLVVIAPFTVSPTVPKAQARCTSIFSCPDLDPTDPRFDPSKVVPGSDIAAAEAWGAAGSVGYPGAAQIMATKNSGKPRAALIWAHKRLLKAQYGSLVDIVIVVYGAQLTDTWCGPGKCIHLGGIDTGAQTFGNIIYIRDRQDSSSINQFLTIAHEMKHVQQQNGFSMANFGYKYFKSYKQVGMNYENVSFEKEAYAAQDWFRNRVICPSTGCQWK